MDFDAVATAIGTGVLGKAATVAGFVPGIGKPLAVALKSFEAGTRYLSGDWSAAQAVASALSELIGARYGKAITGSGSIAEQAFRSAGFEVTKHLSIELGRILSDATLSPEQRANALRGAVAGALIKGLQGAVSKALSGGLKLGVSDEQRAAVYEQFKAVAEKLGLAPALVDPVLKPLKAAR